MNIRDALATTRYEESGDEDDVDAYVERSKYSGRPIIAKQSYPRRPFTIRKENAR